MTAGGRTLDLAGASWRTSTAIGIPSRKLHQPHTEVVAIVRRVTDEFGVVRNWAGNNLPIAGDKHSSKCALTSKDRQDTSRYHTTCPTSLRNGPTPDHGNQCRTLWAYQNSSAMRDKQPWSRTSKSSSHQFITGIMALYVKIYLCLITSIYSFLRSFRARGAIPINIVYVVAIGEQACTVSRVLIRVEPYR